MPQLDPISFSSQLFWLTLCFAVLYVLLARFLLPRVHNVLALRADTLTGDIAAAERMKQDADQARSTYEAALSSARGRSQMMLKEAQSSIAERFAKQQAELDTELLKKIANAEASIVKAKQDATSHLSPVATELASLIVEVLVHHKPNAKDVGAAISIQEKERRM
jgi:F-type H+-transporting ATPase subunit b